MTDNWRNWPVEQGYRTAHEQEKDGSYHFTVMKADLGDFSSTQMGNTEGNHDESSERKTGTSI